MAVMWFSLVVLPTIITFDYNFYIIDSFSADEIISGRGAVGDSWLFFGVSGINVHGNKGMKMF